MDKIIIKGLKCECIIGVLDFERKNKQVLIFDLVLFGDFTKVEKSDDIQDAIDYRVVKNIKERVEVSEFKTLEALCGFVSELCLSTPNCIEAQVTVNKPLAAELIGVDSVEVQIVRPV